MSISITRPRWFLLLGLAGFTVLAAVLGFSTREPTLEGFRVRDLVASARSVDSESAAVLRRNGSNSVPGLVQIFSSRPSLAGRFVGDLNKHYWICGRLPRRMQDWLNETQQKAIAREADREWAVVWCASLNQDAASARPALLRACRDPNPRVRAEAVKALLRTEVPPAVAVPMLTKVLLYDNSTQVRSCAALYLGLLHESAEPAVPALRQATNSPDYLLGLRAREALKKIELAVAQEHAKTNSDAGAPEAR